ncbi:MULTISPECIES: TIGR03643 family protein [unclassified Mucilaginibacter]|uniref:TIGR03643 family protein n=1 Tax=unclassified Mucilaginibacter TaxID=2617802 RepID=UPI002AC96464|nr:MULTISPECIES: TIGR03643 family protein [unclassified Mucilaginibacter]MEB0263039.1 TIGR03643 family protein [Mucilaginibacter sp. 10I4]MEB0277915.1 TIGR03643 family protein [Mucilaginibacter sp. 10B2]MEB0301995.1 TIGR03643 family protein [Mucilaginibacter sp. 5C4]WPX22806.1 TIGR03643 family protein [Mucilaginibacter sp. 5C4]
MSTAAIIKDLSTIDIDRVIEMAWEDRTPFDAIKAQFGLSEQNVIDLMRRQMKLSSFKMWRARVQGRQTKHAKLQVDGTDRFKCNLQRQITLNRISKR